jgi:hypothetical protein
VLGIHSEVGPFARVGSMVAQFFASIHVADVAPTLTADAVIVLIVTRVRAACSRP